MTGRNCHAGIMGVVLNENSSRRLLVGPSPLNGSLTFLKSFQMMSSQWSLNYALCNKSIGSIGSVGKKDRKSNQKEGGGQIGIGLGYPAR